MTQAQDAGWITDLMDRLGAPGAGLAVALENLFPPIPSEVILPLAGFAAGQGRMSLLAAITWTTLCLLYTSPSPRDQRGSRMPSSA